MATRPPPQFAPSALDARISRRSAAIRQRIERHLGRNKPLTEDEIHAAMRPRGRRFWLIGAVALIIAAYFLATPLLGLVALVLLAVGLLPEVWLWISLRGVRFRRTIAQPLIQIGETCTVTYQVENRKVFPIPWLEIEDEYDATLRYLGARPFKSFQADRNLLIAALSLWTFQRVTRRYRVLATARGVYAFGPAYVRAGDPFGFLDNERKIGRDFHDDTVTVLPLTVPLEHFGIPSRRPFGDLRAPIPTFEDPSQIVGARDFQPSDGLRRVHWKATARVGSLQSKVYPPTTNHTLMLLLDINSTANPLIGIDPPLMELGIAAAASIASWAARHHFAIGISSNGLPRSGVGTRSTSIEDVVMAMRVAPGSHPDQLLRVLKVLAQVQPYFGRSMARVVAREEPRLPLGATVIYITAAAAITPGVIQQLERMGRHGHVVAVLLTGDSPTETGRLLTYRLGGADRWYELATKSARALGLDADDAAPEHGDRDDGGGSAYAGGTPDRDPLDQYRSQSGFTLG